MTLQSGTAAKRHSLRVRARLQTCRSLVLEEQALVPALPPESFSTESKRDEPSAEALGGARNI